MGTVRRVVHRQLTRCQSSSAANLDKDRAFQQARPFHEIPSPAPCLPLVGHAYLFTKSFRKNFYKHFMGYYKKHGPLVRMNIMGHQGVFVFEPQDVETVHRHDVRHPYMPGFEVFRIYRREMRPELFPAPAGLLAEQGEAWQRVRSAVQQDMLRPQAALRYTDRLASIADDFCDLLEAKVDDDRMLTCDLTHLLHYWALESISCIFLDTRLGVVGAPDGSVERDVADRLMRSAKTALENLDPVVYYPPVWRHLPRLVPYYVRFDRAMQEVTEDARRLIRQAKERFDPDREKDQKGVLQKLVEKCGEDSSIPDMMAVDAIMAGMDTTGNTAAFLLYHLATNPACQERLYGELLSVLGRRREPLAARHLGRLPYLRACLHESQRILPAAVGTNRLVQREFVLRGYRIPVGSIAFLQSQVMGRTQFPDPLEFVPERWVRGSRHQSKAHPFAWQVFGHGPKSCVGRRFATTETCVLAAAVVRRYKLEYEGPPVDTDNMFVSRPDREIRLRLTPRDN